MRIQAKVRRLAAAGGAVIVGFSIVGWAPLPLPTVSPTTPAPLPSIAAQVGGLLSPGSNQSTTGGTQTAGPAARPGSSAPTSSGGAVTSSSGGATQLTLAAPGAVPAAPPAQSAAVQTSVDAAHTSRSSALPVTGAGPGGAGGFPAPFAPAAVAGLVVLLGFIGLRMTAPAPVAYRRYRVRVRVGSPAPGAPAGAAVAAAISLLVSTLPPSFSVRQAGPSTVLVEAPMLHRALLFNRLGEIAGRARRVGLSFDWGAEREPGRSLGIRLALG